MFIHDYKPIYDSAKMLFANTEKMQKEIESGLQFVQYYFPKYKVPEHVITFIGPVEGYANVLTSSGLAVGLQLYLGKDFPVFLHPKTNEEYALARTERKVGKGYTGFTFDASSKDSPINLLIEEMVFFGFVMA